MKQIKHFDLVESIKSYFKMTPYQEIIPWIEKNITLVDDVSSERDNVDFSKYCYQVPILKTWEDFNKRKIVTVVSVEQIRKKHMLGVWYTISHGLHTFANAHLLSVGFACSREQPDEA